MSAAMSQRGFLSLIMAAFGADLGAALGFLIYTFGLAQGLFHAGGNSLTNAVHAAHAGGLLGFAAGGVLSWLAFDRERT